MKTTSLKLSQRLEALNVPQVSDFYWSENEHGIAGWNVFYVNESLGREEWFTKNDECISSYSSDELGEWLPFSFKRGEKDCTWEFYKDTKGGWECWINEHDGRGYSYTYAKQKADTLAEAMGLMLEYLIINGYIKVEDLK